MTRNHAWDYENRLTQVTLPGSGGAVMFKYDPFGRRIYKSSSAGTSVFAYDGNNPIEEVNASGAVVARYTQGQNIDEPLAMSSSGATSYYEADGLGSVTSLTSSAGALAQTYTFDSFGKLTNSTGSLTNPFQYTAREFDPETGLYYYRARYYDPSTSRFLNEDPLRFVVNPNFYQYAWNQPIQLKDPLGLYDFVGHYFGGSGEKLDLGAIGLGSAFEHASSVQQQVMSFQPVLQSQAGEIAKKKCVGTSGTISFSFSFGDRQVTNVTWEPGLFAVGHSTFFRQATCNVVANCCSHRLNLSCSERFYIRDKFKDPLDGEKIGHPFELPFGVPYDINYDFYRQFSSLTGSSF